MWFVLANQHLLIQLNGKMEWRKEEEKLWVIFPKYSRANVAMSIMVAWRFLKQYRLRARWSPAFSSGFRPWPLLTKISLDSRNLFTILWTVDGERPKLSGVELFLFCVILYPFILTFCSLLSAILDTVFISFTCCQLCSGHLNPAFPLQVVRLF